MSDNLFRAIRTAHPVVHCITNHVTSNDCANLLLACGAIPVMADAPEETAEITARSSALVINLGTPRSSTLPAMLAAGREAARLGHPIVFDPVGVGASEFRNEMARTILRELPITVIRGNRREIGVLCKSAGSVGDASELARKFGCIVIISGEEDFLTDGNISRRIRNGHPILRQITGAGCMLSALLGAFLSTMPVDADASVRLNACAKAVGAMGFAGEIAAARMRPEDGNASCRNYLIDALYRMDDEQLEAGIKMN